MNDKEVWTCPICGSRAYQKWGGKMERVSVGNSESPEYRKMGTHYMCKGCSVFFNNPRIFNKRATNETRANNMAKLMTWVEEVYEDELKQMRENGV